MRYDHGRACLCDPRSRPARWYSRQAMPVDGRYAGSAPEWKPRMLRLNTAVALTLVLMLLGATPAMAMAADLQVSTEVFVEAGDSPSFSCSRHPPFCIQQPSPRRPTLPCRLPCRCCWLLNWMSLATFPT